MTKWLPIVLGIVVLTAIFVLARFVSDSGNELLESVPPSSNKVQPATKPVPDSAANRMEQMPSENGDESVSGTHEAVDGRVQPDLEPRATELTGRTDPEMVGTEPENRGINMPGLVIGSDDSDGVSTGPSQTNIEMPGPEIGDVNVAGVGPFNQAPESIPDSFESPVDVHLLDSGPSQTNIGLPGPGQEGSQIAESTDSVEGLTDGQDGSQPFPDR